MDGRKALARAFGAYVADHSLTQTDVAARGGPSTTSQTKIQKATEPISPQTLQKIDKATGWPPGTSARILAGGMDLTEQRTIEQLSNDELVAEIHRLVEVVSQRLRERSEPDDAPAHQKSADEVDVDGAASVKPLRSRRRMLTQQHQPAPDRPPS